MQLETVILWAERTAPSSPRARRGSLEAGSAGAGPNARVRTRGAADALKIETALTTSAERRDLSQNPAVLGFAPPMPAGLVRPVSVEAGSQSAGKSNWGMAEIGVDRTDATGAGVTVAVLDTGVDRRHEAFSGLDLEENDVRNFTTDVPEDIDGHGTHCAGTIVGRDCEGIRIGVSRGVTRLLVGKVIGKDGGSTEGIFNAMLWAQQNGAHVISMSLGMDFPGYQHNLMEQYGLDPEHATSMALAGYRANIRLFDRMSQVVAGPDGVIGGSVVVAAAGNESRRPRYAITASPPAAAALFLSVGALEKSEDGALRVAEFSNDGVSLVAPGVDVWSARLGGGLAKMSGTSMAGPHVAGLAALWAEELIAKGRFRASTVLDLVKRSTRRLDPTLAQEDVGDGLPQAPPPRAGA